MKISLTLPLLFLLTACNTYNYGPMPGDEKYLVATKNVPTAEQAVYIAEASLFLRKQLYSPLFGGRFNRWDGILFVTPKSLVFMDVYERTGRFIEFFSMHYSEIEKINESTEMFRPVVSREEYPFSIASQVNSEGQAVTLSEVNDYIKKNIKEQQKQPPVQ